MKTNQHNFASIIERLSAQYKVDNSFEQSIANYPSVKIAENSRQRNLLSLLLEFSLSSSLHIPCTSFEQVTTSAICKLTITAKLTVSFLNFIWHLNFCNFSFAFWTSVQQCFNVSLFLPILFPFSIRAVNVPVCAWYLIGVGKPLIRCKAVG